MNDSQETPSYKGRRVWRYTVLVDVEAVNDVESAKKLHAALADFNQDFQPAGLVCLNDRMPVAEPFDLERHERARQVLERAGLLS